MSAEARVPVIVVTGALGSGKTTLINAMLASNSLGPAAFIVNEFGDIDIDGALVETADEHVITLLNGCICCSIRGDLLATLKSLLGHRREGTYDFDRIVIETTGIADPGPLLHTFVAAEEVSGLLTAETVIAVASAVHFLQQACANSVTARQIAVADQVVLSKTDLADIQRQKRVRDVLKLLNPTAQIWTKPNFVDGFEELISSVLVHNPSKWIGKTPSHHDHSGISTTVLTSSKPLMWTSLSDALDFLTNAHGDKVLRLKGILEIKGSNSPIVIHGIHHLLHPPLVLPRWPNDIRGSKLVIISQYIAQETIANALRPFLPTVHLGDYHHNPHQHEHHHDHQNRQSQC